MEDGQRQVVRVGTPHGSVISPLLANIYLHYVHHLWVQQWRTQRTDGQVIVIRYADDIVVGFEHAAQAEQFLVLLKARLAEFGLSLNEAKTRIVAFGKHGLRNRAARGERRPETFDFLGFTHACGVQRNRPNRFLLRRFTIKTRTCAALRSIREVLWKRRATPVASVDNWLHRVLTWYFQYYAVPGNSDRLTTFRREVGRAWYASLKRRGSGRGVTWPRMIRLIRIYLPLVRVLHPYPDARFASRP